MVFLVVGGYLLVYEHRAHLVAGIEPLLALFVACLGMYVFMHGGHRSNDYRNTN
jgi:hypothetical protein